MRLNTMELGNLSQKLLARINHDLYMENQNDCVDIFLKKLGYNDFIEEKNAPYNTKNAKILIIGECQIKKEYIMAISKKLGILPKNIEIIDDYEKITNIDFSRFEYNDNYSDIIVGPCPHKARGIGDHSSFIRMIEHDPEKYPKLIRAMSGEELKITKKSIEIALKQTRQYLDLYDC